MELYKKLENGLPVGDLIIESNLLQIHPDIPVCGNGYILPESVIPFGFTKFVTTPAPVSDNLLQEYVEDHPEESTDHIFYQKWKLVDKTFDTPEAKAEAVLANNTAKLKVKLVELTDAFLAAAKRPRVDIPSLGYAVDGSYEDLQNFLIGKDLSLPIIRDADNVVHELQVSDYDTIIQAIKEKSLQIIQTKWTVETELRAIDLTTEAAYAALDAVDVKGVLGAANKDSTVAS